MKSWKERTHEERHLLNPAFCSALLWFAARGAAARATHPRTSLSFLEAFLVLPLVLHQKSRQALPSILTSSLPVWISSQPLLVANLPIRARSLVPYTKEAITFGGISRLFLIEEDQITNTQTFDLPIKRMLQQSSDEVKECMKKAEFVGKWFAHTGAPETIFTLFGIRP
ncbi:MAG: three component ABC system middle component [Verrucomicrobiota bacterium]